MKQILLIIVLGFALPSFSWEGMPMPRLHVEGRYLKDPQGKTVNLHGFAQTYSPFFNEVGKYWDNYNVQGCLRYNQEKIDEILRAGWKMSFLRLHMDPYWSNTPGCSGRYEGEECFNEDRFRKYLDEVFVPMAEYAVSKGIYVVMRPPGVCPHEIEVGDVYNNYLIQVWTIVAQHPILKNHPNIMFELANEPVNIRDPQGRFGASNQGHFDNLKIYFQAVVDAIRAQGCNNILWVPGLGYQSLFKGLAANPIEGENIGYAVHLYPGWLGSDGENQDGGIGTGGGYEAFQAGWNEHVKPVADFAPVMITEMDWAQAKYNSSWGKSITGVAGGTGFGANMKKIADASGNVSWLIFTEPYLLAQFKNTPPREGEPFVFLNDPEACPWPTFHWYEEYAVRSEPKPCKEVLTIPGLIQAEDFDIGGQGISYSDNDPENQGGEYRDEGVDITTDNEGNYVVGWTEVGEWLSYSINVDSTAKYLWEARVSSAMDNSSFKIFVDDKDVSGNIVVPNTDSWDSYVTINGTTENITAGKHILKISITGAFVNIDWLKFSELNTVSIIKTLSETPKSPVNFFNLKGQLKLQSNKPVSSTLPKKTNRQLTRAP